MTAQMKRQTAKKSQIEIETIAAEIGDLWRFTCEMQRTKFHLDKQDYSSDGPSGPCGVSLDVSCLSAEKEAEFRRDILKHSLSIAELKSPKDAVIIVAYMCSVFDWICE